MHVWDNFLTERDRAVFQKGGYGRQVGFGQRPALLIIDVTYGFVGDVSEPILESIRRWRHSCGEEGWVAVRCIQSVLEAARSKNIPIVYTCGEARPDFADVGIRNMKSYRAREAADIEGDKGTRIVEELTPRPSEMVLVKKRASAFFGTPLISYLIGWGVDTLIVAGCTTSGCVRATVVEGQSYNLRMIVVEDGVFDRGEASHALSLWDMQMKYADVTPSHQVTTYLRGLGASQISSSQS